MIYLFSLAVVSGLIAFVIVGFRIYAIRSGWIVIFDQPALFTAIQERIDWLAVFLVLLFREGFKYLSIRVLVAVKKLGSYLKIAGIRIEKRFERVINLVHGKNATSKKGAVSFFLREIAENKGLPKVKSSK